VAVALRDESAAEWALATRELLDDAARWSRYSAAGRARAATFSWQASAESTAQVYRTIARR
jgi:glycosyltransferase involved in cell wall biosynthesis